MPTNLTQEEIERLKKLLSGNSRVPKDISVPQDAISETMIISGTPSRQDVQISQSIAESDKKGKDQRKKADAIKKYKENQPPVISSANPVWGYSPEVRRELGYYTQDEREQAAKMNEMRSSTFLGNVMPNFGPQFAYMNPGVEYDAYRQTGLYLPNSFMLGTSFTAPSATYTTLSGLKSGLQTAGNISQKVGSAVTTAAKEAIPVVTNPRWAAGTLAFTVPGLAHAANEAVNEGSYWPAGIALGLGLGFPAIFGASKLFKNSKGVQVEDPTKYSADKRFWTWERPGSWVERQPEIIRQQQMDEIINEYNQIMRTNPSKLQEFITKHNIRQIGPEGIEFETITKTIPVTERVARMKKEPIMSTQTTGKGKKAKTITTPVRDANGEIVYQEVPVYNNKGKQIFDTKQKVDAQGNPVTTTKTQTKEKRDQDGNPIYKYVEPTSVRSILEGKNSNYTANFKSQEIPILTGPTTGQKMGAYLRNLGRAAAWSSYPTALSWLTTALWPNTTTNSNTNSDINPNNPGWELSSEQDTVPVKRVTITPDVNPNDTIPFDI